MKAMRAERIKVMLAAVVVAAGFALFAALQGPAAWGLAPIVIGFWTVVFMPRWRRKLREKSRAVPTWQLHPE